MSADDGGGRVQHPTVLIVDDEEGVRSILTRLLAHIGYSVITASDGEMALDMVRSNALQIDCVLLDVAMPGMNGLQLARLLREQDPDVPLVMMSGHAVPWLPGLTDELGLAGFLQKPFAYDELRQILSAATAA
jgi:two-component system, cell cycle sensor histidine kinase and response regulator CckA